jgi:electron transfer flavoprotein alpha/beta subunit
VPGAVAATLGWPHVWLATALTLDQGGEAAEVLRELEGGRSERCRVRLPAVVSVQVGAWSLGMASVRDLLAARRKEIEGRRAEVPPSREPRSGLCLEAWLEPEARESGVEMLSGEPDEMARDLVSRLEREGWL